MTGERTRDTPGGDINKRIASLFNVKQISPAERDAFAKFRSIPVMTVVDGITAVAPRDIHVIVEKTFNGNAIPWNSDQAPGRLMIHLHDYQSVYQRAIATALDLQEAPETHQTFDLLEQQLQRFPLSGRLGETRDMKEWWFKVMLLSHVYGSIQQKLIFDETVFGENRLTPQIQQFSDHYASYLRGMPSLIGGVNLEQLDWFIQFDDVERLADSSKGMGNVNWSQLRRRKIAPNVPQRLVILMNDAHHDAFLKADLDLFLDCVENPKISKWSELQNNWTWQKVVTAINALPSITSDGTIARVADALDDTLDTEIPGSLNLRDISPEGVLALMHYDIPKNVHDLEFLDTSPEVNQNGDMIGYRTLSVPRKLVPAATARLMEVLSAQASEADFNEFFQRVQTLAFRKKQPDSFHEWLLLVTILRDSDNTEVVKRAQGAVSRRDFPHPPFQDIFLNKKRGKIWLLDNGTIKVTDGKDLAGAHCLYTSTYIESTEPAQYKPILGAPVSRPVAPSQPIVRPEREERVKEVSPKPARPLTPIQQVLAQPVSSAEQQKKPKFEISLEEGKELKDVAHVSDIDLELVRKALSEYQQNGRYKIEPLRAKSADGEPQAKMRVNGVDSGIRVIMLKRGNTLIVDSIRYRGSAYKNL